MGARVLFSQSSNGDCRLCILLLSNNKGPASHSVKACASALTSQPKQCTKSLRKQELMGLSNPVLSGWPCSAFERQLEARERAQLRIYCAATDQQQTIDLEQDTEREALSREVCTISLQRHLLLHC